MAGTARDRLLGALENLREQELKRFRMKLSEIPLAEGYANIPRGRLEKADALDLCDLLISFYTEGYALEVAAEVLEAVNCRDQAQQLRQAAGTGRQSHQGRVSPALHFTERHREELIQRTATVEGVLDMLHGTILDEEQYQKISSRVTSQDKMRELYKLVPSWNGSCKDKLYEALKTKNKFLIADLEGR
ncbi:apoptosis-associated speck-like protein containing a CARD [Tiliqua scincoides]|uniref:apoptosis-associated speck-like protein containing a CARD n=1 Tax=Tiliqua scincoides TaxID=71010 RepID=UPI0034621A83